MYKYTAAKLWSGRSAGETDKRLDEFNSSVSFDCRMYKEDIAGSAAHAEMLGRQGIISSEDSEAIVKGLRGICDDIESGVLAIDPAAEDIHMFIESALTERIGEAGKRLHTGRSRNDQTATDLRLYAKKALNCLSVKLKALIGVLLKHAKEHTETVMPGYTHLQRAQPITLAHHLCAWCQMFLRDISRLSDAGRRLDESPLGCGALASTTYPLDREWVAKELGFSGICRNSLDGVSDRDYCAEILSALALMMTHLTRISEEIILWCSLEFGFAELSDAFSTGSSIMPQKKNPDICELIRGKAGRVYGDLIGTLTMLKSLPLAYNKDMQEDKEALFDGFDTASACLDALIPMVETIAFQAGRMRSAAARGFINATDCADYLTKKGMPFREAYSVAGKLVSECECLGKTLETLPLENYQAHSEMFSDDIYQTLRLESCIQRRDLPGGPSPRAVGEHIKYLEDCITP
ncbi:MAG: argininosuccinate lyase [Oscillospiraceae bacterium]|nr:argininosuccinate lyase [Oscillospiraceae bacterium]